MKNNDDNLEGKAADLDVDITPVGNDDYEIQISLIVAIPVVIAFVVFCGSLIFFLWR